MRFLTSATVAVCVSLHYGFVSASPITVEETSEVSTLGGKTFTLHQQRNKAFSGVRSGALELAKAYARSGIAVPDDLQASVTKLREERRSWGKRDHNSPRDDLIQTTIPAIPFGIDREYFVPVQVGTPPKTFNVDIATDTTAFWMLSSETPSERRGGNEVYDLEASSTIQRLPGLTWQLEVSDANRLTGSVLTDVVSVGSITVQNQTIQSVSGINFDPDFGYGGELGLGWGHMKGIDQPVVQNSFFDNISQRMIPLVFTANLKYGKAGNYNFGFINDAEYMGSISYVPVNTEAGTWRFNVSGILIDNSFFPLPHVADAVTNTDLLVLPADIVDAYYSQVQGAVKDGSQYVFPCDTDLPQFTAIIGDKFAVIPGDFIRGGDPNAQTCTGTIQAVDGQDIATYGDTFLKSQFVVFDFGNQQLGLATKLLI